MSGEIPVITAEEAAKAFKKAGFVLKRIKGSHHIFGKKGHRYILSVPFHKGKTLGKGLLNSLIEASGLSVEKFLQLLKE